MGLLLDKIFPEKSGPYRSWINQLLSASFKGSDFSVFAARKTGGRRLVEHVFPGKDDSYFEDLGKKNNTLPVTAYVVGDDFLHKLSVLENTLEQSGEGALVHPWYGDVDCVVEDFTTSFSSTEGRYAVVDILFKRFTAQDLTIIGPSSFDNLATKKKTFLDRLNDALEDAYDGASTPATLVTDLTEIANMALDIVDNTKRIVGTTDEFKLAVSTLRGKFIEFQLSNQILAQSFTDLINFGTDPGDANYSAFSLTTEGKEQYSTRH
jgi:prophage DNA circulation protein